MLNEISKYHLNHISVWYLVQHSLSSFKKVIGHFGSAEKAISASALEKWPELSIHQNHIQRAQSFLTDNEQKKFQKCIDLIQSHADFILLDSDPNYPKQLLPYNDRPPLLFGRGSYQNLSQPQVAIVGSRKPSPHGKQVAYDFAYYLSEKGFYVTSGLAQGIDEAAHQGALKNQRTIAVIGTGLDSVYPTQNRSLQEEILKNSGTVITEFLPETKPLQHHFPRRNRIVSGLSLGVLVAEAKLESGSLITAQAAANQGKITFAIPGHIYSDFHQGCHQLIREGAILVDHPEQIIEDLALPTQWQHHENHPSNQNHLTDLNQENEKQSPIKKNNKTQKVNVTQKTLSKDAVENSAQSNVVTSTPITLEIPAHLFKLYQQLDWVGQTLDHLAIELEMDTASLTSALMELELMGFALQQSGLYLRCRQSH